MNSVLALEMLSKRFNKNNKNKLASHMHVLEAFHGRIAVLIEMYNESSASKKALQKCVDREIARLKVVNGEVPDTIKDLLNENGLKY